jgi:heat shock protein HtpX
VWEQIRSNQIRSVVLTIGMGALLILIGYVLGLYFFGNPTGGLIIAILVWAVLALVGYFQGDSILLSMSGAKKISPDDHPRLYNVVEEMKIASGLKRVPDIYIIDDPALNAFATGRDPNRASVAITSGLLQKLNRDELQGVIGHEISHIKHRDVLLMAMCSIILGTIVLLAWYGSRILFFGGMTGSRRSSSGGGSQGQLIILIVALVFMILAPIFAQLICFAISRRREYLADASSALYTRYPEGLASALEKIGTSTGQLKSANQATAPMYIVNPFRRKGMPANDLSATHPPISERIRILRAMAGASFTDYDQAYRQVHGRKGVIPAASLAAAAVPIKTVKLEGEAGELSEVQRARETSDVMWRLNNYNTITCQCGAKLRVPPNFKQSEITCPHCGRTHQIG